MVLENSTAEDGFVDSSAPPSDDDVYDSQNSFYQPLPANLPRAIFGNERALRLLIAMRLKDHEALLKRPLTKAEAEFSTYYSAKYYSISTYGPPVGLCAGLWRAYDTRPSFKFPFVTRGRFNPNLETFPHPRLPLLRGGFAKSAWHSIRISAYLFMGLSFANVFFSVYAAAATSSAVAKDPRAKVFIEAMKEKRNESANSKSPANGRPAQAPSTDGYQKSSSSNGIELPSPENEPEETYSARESQEPFSLNTSEPQSNEEHDKKPPTSGGSAWDRLRQQGVSGQKSSWEGSEVREESRNDRRSFSSKRPEDDTQSAREKAQREFDKQVEQERRGGGFDGGKGGSDRW